MKFVVLVLIVMLVVWLARRERPRPAPPNKPEAPRALEDMVSCAQCGMHLPRSDALPGRGGLYCGEPHRALHERELAAR